MYSNSMLLRKLSVYKKVNRKESKEKEERKKTHGQFASIASRGQGSHIGNHEPFSNFSLFSYTALLLCSFFFAFLSSLSSSRSRIQSVYYASLNLMRH